MCWLIASACIGLRRGKSSIGSSVCSIAAELGPMAFLVDVHSTYYIYPPLSMLRSTQVMSISAPSALPIESRRYYRVRLFASLTGTNH